MKKEGVYPRKRAEASAKALRHERIQNSMEHKEIREVMGGKTTKAGGVGF